MDYPYLQFPGNLKPLDLTKAFGSINDAMDYYGQSELQKREQARKDAEAAQKAKFENDQNENSRQRQLNEERKAAVHEAQAQARSQKEDAQKIGAFLGAGNTQGAQSLAAASQYEDPRNKGTVLGASLKHYLTGPDGKPMTDADGKPMDYDTAIKSLPGQGPAPMMPGEVDPGQALGRFLGQTPKEDSLQPPNFGQEPPPPEAPPDPTAAAAGLMQLPGMQAMGAGAAGMQNQENQTNYDQQMAQREKDKQVGAAEAAKRERWGLSFAGGPETLIDPNQERDAARQRAEEEAQTMEAQLTATTDPVVRDALKRQIIEKRMMIDKMGRAAVDNAGAQSQSEQFKVGRDDRNQLTRGEQLEKARIGASGHHGSSQEEFEKAKLQQKQIQAATAYDPVIQHVLQRNNYNDVQTQNAQIASLYDLSKIADKSPAAADLLKGRFAKFAQGAGVLTDQDMKTFWYDIGGKLGIMDSDGNIDFTKGTNMIRDYFTGTIDPKFRDGVATALRQLEGTMQARSNVVGKALETQLRTYGADQTMIDGTLATYAPLYVQHGAGTPGDATGAVQRPLRQPHPGGGKHAAPAPAPGAPQGDGPQPPPDDVVQKAKQAAAAGNASAKAWLQQWRIQ